MSRTAMIRRAVLRPLSLLVLVTALALSACSSVAGTSPSTSPPATPATPSSTAGSSPSSTPTDPSDVLVLHYLRSTIAGRQAEHTATVRGDGQVALADEIDGTEHRFTLTQPELARVGELLPVLADAPEPTNVVSDVGTIDARFAVGGREVSVSVDDWSMAGGTARLPADERAVADAMIELRDLLIRERVAGSAPGSAPSSGAAPTS